MNMQVNATFGFLKIVGEVSTAACVYVCGGAQGLL